MNEKLINYTFFARFVLAAAYVVVGCWIVFLIFARSSDAPVAARALKTNDHLTADDLRTTATRALIGDYVKADIAEGEPVTSDEVSRSPIDTNLAPALAAIVPIKPETLKARRLDKGAKVVLTFADKTQPLMGAIADVVCDNSLCKAIVDLDKATGRTFDAVDFSKADVVPLPEPAIGP